MPDYLTEFMSIPKDKRIRESSRIRSKYPDRCCVIVTKQQGSDVPDIDRHKFLVPGDLTMGQFTFVIRKRLKIPPTKAIFMFINNTLPATSSNMALIYDEKKMDDGFLYITYAAENTFG